MIKFKYVFYAIILATLTVLVFYNLSIFLIILSIVCGAVVSVGMLIVMFSIYMLDVILGINVIKFFNDKFYENAHQLTVNGIIYVCAENKIILIEKGKDPKGLAMFSTQVKLKESPEEALIKGISKELNITNINKLNLISVDYDKNSKQDVVEITYSCITSQVPKMDKMKFIDLYNFDQISEGIKSNNLAFSTTNHAGILIKYFNKLKYCNPCNENCD